MSVRLRLTPLALLAAALPAPAQDAAPQRVDITGSAIRRIQAEGALPVQIIRREDIERSGATSVQELIQALPVMQGFTTEGQSVGGGGGGFSGASLRNQAEIRTLVLLNGRRVAPAGSQTLTGFSAAVNLNTLPLAAIERVEVLTDGASALYGSDAIGGVVNFITRRNVAFVELGGGLQLPDGGQGQERVATLVAGWGALDRDGWNVMLAASRNDRDPLRAIDRRYTRSARFDFSANGREYTFLNGSPRPIPANVVIGSSLVSPTVKPGGSCPAQTFLEPESGACYYDFATQLEIYPEAVRDNLFGSLSTRFGEHTLQLDVLHSRSVTTSRTAPPPGSAVVRADSPYAQLIREAAAARGLGEPEFPVTAEYRVADVGRRTTRDTHRADHVDLSFDGALAGWDTTLAATWSRARYDEILAGGWVQQNPFDAALGSGLINPFVGPGQQSSQAQALLDAAVIRGAFDAGTTTSKQALVKGSRPLARLGGGDALLALGLAWMNEQFDKRPSELAQGRDAQGRPDTRFGDSSAIIPYSARRRVQAAFAELALPLAKSLELTPSARHDRYPDFGHKTTWKLAARWQPAREWLLRGSVGTGFKAPTVPQINAATQSYGVTGGSYSCRNSPALAQLAAELQARCPAGGGNAQFDVLASGNRRLSPETSRQWTLGLRFEPGEGFTVGADYWVIRLDNQIGQLAEDTVFADPLRFRSSFTTFVDPSTREVLLAQFAGNVNLGKVETRGIDLDASARARIGAARWTGRFTATHLLRDRFEVVPGEGFLSDLGAFQNGTVALRWKARMSNTLDIGGWTHNVSVNYQSGYHDDPTPVLQRGTTSYEVLQRDVASHWTLDWQSRWAVDRQLSLVFGAVNLLNREPPLSISFNVGGQMVGYDSRYHDSRGRTLYLRAHYRFR